MHTSAIAIVIGGPEPDSSSNSQSDAGTNSQPDAKPNTHSFAEPDRPSNPRVTGRAHADADAGAEPNRCSDLQSDSDSACDTVSRATHHDAYGQPRDRYRDGAVAAGGHARCRARGLD